MRRYVGDFASPGGGKFLGQNLGETFGLEILKDLQEKNVYFLPRAKDRTEDDRTVVLVHFTTSCYVHV